jgi:CHAT domain-containing protein
LRAIEKIFYLHIVQLLIRDEVEPAYRQFVDVLLQNAPGIAEPSQDNLKQAREVIEALQIAELNNFFREACLKPKTKEADQIDPNAAIIYPIILNDRVGVIESRSSNALKYYTSSLSKLEAEELITQIRQDLIKPNSNLENLQDRLAQLYDFIVKPFEQDLEISQQIDASSVKTIVFVLDSLFKNIPMSALYDKGRRQYLVERYSIAVAPSLKLLDSEGLPFLDRVNTLVAGASDAPSFKAEGREFTEIFNVTREIEDIEKELQNSTKLAEREFTKSNLQSQLGANNFSIVHLATHGKFSSNPEQTFILAWDDRIDMRELKSFLTKNVSISKPIELLVLSACQTAKGDNRAALGLAGIAVRAGARSTLASLWQVNDSSTAQLMVKFYQSLKQSKITKSEALRKAQLTLLENLENKPEAIAYKHPYYWSAFTVIGNWR